MSITVYVAGPLGAVEGRLARIHTAMEAAAALLDAGLEPFVPHLSHFLDERHPHDYERWMSWCLVWLRRCDALVRLPGHSPGADREVMFAHAIGRPVFWSTADVIKWVRWCAGHEVTVDDVGAGRWRWRCRCGRTGAPRDRTGAEAGGVIHRAKATKAACR